MPIYRIAVVALRCGCKCSEKPWEPPYLAEVQFRLEIDPELARLCAVQRPRLGVAEIRKFQGRRGRSALKQEDLEMLRQLRREVQGLIPPEDVSETELIADTSAITDQLIRQIHEPAWRGGHRTEGIPTRLAPSGQEALACRRCGARPPVSRRSLHLALRDLQRHASSGRSCPCHETGLRVTAEYLVGPSGGLTPRFGSQTGSQGPPHPPVLARTTSDHQSS